MMSFFSAHTDLNEFGLGPANISEVNKKTILVKKFNWEYTLAHAFQRHCLKLLSENTALRIIICCSHPRVFTNGRGLQKPRKGEVLNLVEFDPYRAKDLPFPFHQIERGGGLTFHHPGQLIIYPMVRLNPTTLSLSSIIDNLLDSATDVLHEWGLEGLSHENKLLGLWHGERKLASIGIAIEKFITFHGMALNFYKDEEMKKALMAVNPCGLNAQTYTSVEELMDVKHKDLEEFAEQFIKKLVERLD